MSFTVHTGDALDVLRSMPDESVNCCVTSPPLDSDAVQFLASHIDRIALGDVFVGKRHVRYFSDGAMGVREVTIPSDFRPMRATIGLKSAQSKYGFSGFFLHEQEWHYLPNDFLGCCIGSLVAEKWTALGEVGLFFVVPSAERIGQHLDGPLVNHADLKSCVISGCLPALALVYPSPLDADVPFAVNEPCNVRQCSIGDFHSVVI